MGTVRLANLDRPGLPVALAMRGIYAHSEPTGHHPCDHGLVFGWSLTAGSPNDRLRAERTRHRGPLIVVLAEVAEAETIAALDAGADDVIPHSMSDAMIAARLAAMLRRHRAAGFIALGDMLIDTTERHVTRAGRSIPLLPREYRLLTELAANAGATVSRMALLSRVWGLGFDPGTNVIEVHVSRLRAKLDRGFAEPMLLTDKGRGYRLVATK